MLVGVIHTPPIKHLWDKNIKANKITFKLHEG